MDERSFGGKTILVTGANRGLGAAFLDILFSHGAAKIYCGARDIANFDDALDRYDGRAIAIALDVTSDADVQRAASALTDVDIIVSNAGVTYMVPLMETSLEGAKHTMDVNYFGPLRLIHAFGAQLNARSGGFVSVLSLAGLVPARDAELYSASKAAGTMLGHAARRVLPNISVSLAYPGLMDTDMMRDAPLVKTSPAEIAANICLGWLAGDVSIFPDLHAQLLRDEYVGRGAEMLTDPFALMGDALQKYMDIRSVPSTI